ncbi:venom prothrombin activator nigrarin-D [Daphnia magna]|uniref:venom prothrombin activator nigrarin-D n=2 Tax=Daphnia magna TaxID=35525 RepID=UPI001E1BCF1C|nr:venom prothrombin activator nigrarin-D [Daphnia magna]
MASATNERRRVVVARFFCLYVLVITISCLSVLPSSSAKTQNSTEWKRKPTAISHPATANGSGVQMAKPLRQHQHRNHHRNKRVEASLLEQNGTTIANRNRNINGSHNNNATKVSSTPSEELSPWSPWSKCNKRCRQNRQRKCIPSTDSEALKRCIQQHVLKQERTCRKGRCKRGGRAFHVVLPPKRESLKQPTTTTSSSASSTQNQQQSDVRVLLSLNSIFYSSWSRWSTCTKACTTTRYRTCRFQVVCGNTVLHEEAYCYTEGTDCEKWYSGRSRYTKDDDRYEHSPVAVAEKSNGNGSANSSNAKGQKKTKDESEVETQPECGVSASGNGGVGSSGVSNLSYNLQLRIIGGREATPGRWPWQVAILNRFKEAFCGGTLIGARWVLTAAHCLRKRLNVRIGEYDLVEHDGTEMDFQVEEVFVHPDYDPETVDNDVALLRLPEAIKLGHQGMRLACLPQPGQSLPITQKCTIIGWGKERSSHVFGTEVLHEAEVPIVKTSACREVYEDYFITDNMFCAGYRKGRIDSCAGDSGGPLLCSVGDRWTIFGITSFGEGCGKRGKFGIYTKVPNYVSWIQRVIDLNGGI